MPGIFKFFGEQDEQAHGGHLHWPGSVDGFPVRGAVKDLRGDEIEQLEVQLDFRSGWFDLSNADEKAQFDDIYNRIVNGWYVEKNRKDHYDETKQAYRIWLEWVQIYSAPPVGVNHETAFAR